ncbi:hypothetical protein [Helicobacter sp. 11S02596-1]|uniref:hypothetical protein n=1 Tax=Helicobacter sp. 11S02596-1 TaxID=1476194 RepID=UPI000BA77D30|nr:hypothetical protein [Helicobacter sp. 11S02596-1]PAF41382.1 hypothetical protein BJI48_08810 [Helicobacter sp. 11S02596-1]
MTIEEIEEYAGAFSNIDTKSLDINFRLGVKDDVFKEMVALRAKIPQDRLLEAEQEAEIMYGSMRSEEDFFEGIIELETESNKDEISKIIKKYALFVGLYFEIDVFDYPVEN